MNLNNFISFIIILKLSQPSECFEGDLINQAKPENISRSRPVMMSEGEVYIPDIPYVTAPRFNYAEALAKSMLFFEAQRSGKLPEDQRVKWRGDSALKDGEDAGIDLSGGYYDGASYVKYGYTMAFATTVLSWGVVRYRRAYEILEQLDYALATIKWATDYFIKCHPSENVFYGQVSDKAADSQFWGRPEDMEYLRHSYKITIRNPGSDLAGETAAALAAASIVFQPTDSDYSALLLEHAEQLYKFGRIYQGKYSDSIQPANQAYGSTTYEDDLAWAATWLYKRTGDSSYLSQAENFYRKAELHTLATEFSWSNKQAGVQVLLAEITDKKKYRRAAQMFCEYAQPYSSKKFRTRVTYTPGGLLYINQWGPLRYAANSAFLCAMVADIGINSTQNRQFAARQMNYILGSTGRSYVVGFGEKYPTKPYHKSSYCPSPPASCPRFNEEIPNAHVLYGALVGGPSNDDSFQNQRSNEKQSSVTLDFNAGFQSALAALLDLYIFGPNKRPHIDEAGTITTEEATIPPPTVSTTPDPDKGIDWPAILRSSLLFFEAQRSGALLPNNRIGWRSDSALGDGIKDFDLSGGYYDGSGYIKYGFPLCYSMTMLSWSLIEYADAYKAAGEYNNAIEALRWGMEYILKTHIKIQKDANGTTERMIVGQVGSISMERESWERPENISSNRDVYLISPDHPGTELSAEMAASLAAASIVFKNHRNDFFASLLYNHSSYIFRKFAIRSPRATYTTEISDSASEYPSSGYNDELAWAAAWLYENKKHQFFYRFATRFYRKTQPSDFSWDNKTAGVQLLMGVVNRNPTDIVAFCNWLLTSAPRTPKGLLYLHDKYLAKYAASAAFILMLTYEKFPSHINAYKWRDLGHQQVLHLLGSTGQSYMIGYGPNQPTQPYHKASSCPDSPIPCGFYYRNVDKPNPQKLFGALVGGPDAFDDFTDQRIKEEHTRVSLDANAGFQAAVAAVYHLKINNLLSSSANHLVPFLHSSMLLLIIYIFVAIFIEIPIA